MDDTAEYEQYVEQPATAPPEGNRFDPWVGIGYHVIQVLFVAIAFVIATRMAGDLQIGDEQARSGFLFTLSVIGVPAIGVAIALRLGQFDLSIAAMASIGMAIYVVNGGGSSVLLTVIGTALAVGAVTGAVSGWLRISGWLSTLVLSFVLLARFYELVGPAAVTLGDEPPVFEPASTLPVVFLVAGLGAAVIFLVLDLMRRPAQVTRTEHVALGARILLGAGALAISAGLAAFTGVMQAERLRAVSAPGFESLLPAILAAVLIGGVGVFGARVSLAGTMLGAVGMALLQFGAQLAGVEFATRLYMTALPLAIFLLLRGAFGALRGEQFPA